MTRIRKYILGTGIIALLIISAVYYNNSRNDVTVEVENSDQIESESTLRIQNNDTLQDNNDKLVESSSLIDNKDNENNISTYPKKR